MKYCIFYSRSTEEIFALFISMAFAVDAFKDVVYGKIIFLRKLAAAMKSC